MEERLLRLEMLVNNLIKMYGMNKAYTSADIDGTRQSVANITPYTDTKQGFYGETEKVFYDAPSGNTSVFFSDYNGNYTVNRIANRLIVSFDTLAKPTDITISIN